MNQDHTTEVLVQYANENLHLRLEVARLRGELAAHAPDTAEPADE